MTFTLLDLAFALMLLFATQHDYLTRLREEEMNAGNLFDIRVTEMVLSFHVTGDRANLSPTMPFVGMMNSFLLYFCKFFNDYQYRCFAAQVRRKSSEFCER